MNDADSSESTQLLGSKLKMPTFSGSESENINQWLKIFNKWCTLSNFKDNQKSSLLSFVFIGSAAKILAAWDSADAIPNDWAAATAKIKLQFSDSSRTKVHEATLLRRKLLPSESFDEYFADVINLCSLVKPDMPEVDKIQNILKGLPENIVQFLLFKDPQTTEDVLKGYCSLKTAKLLTMPVTEAKEATVAAPAIAEKVTNELTSKFEALMLAQNEKITQLQALVTKQIDEQKCFRCHKPGHMAKDCSLPRTPPVSRNRNFQQRDRQDHRPSQRSDFYSQRRTPSPYRSESRRTPSPYRSNHPERQRNYASPDRYYARGSRDHSSERDFYRRRSPSPYRNSSQSRPSSRYPYYQYTEN
jgi:hypothetical protein